MNLWLRQLKKDVPADLQTPAELARFELDSAFPGLKTELREQTSMGDAYKIDPLDDGSFLLTGGSTGLLYAAYRLITDLLCGQEITRPVSSSPKYALRMINCWDNADGEIERGYAGRSLFSGTGVWTMTRTVSVPWAGSWPLPA